MAWPMDYLWVLEDNLNLRQDRSKNKLIGENALIRVHGRCSLQIMAYGLNSPFALGLALGLFSSCYLLIVHSGPVVPLGQTQV